jgi:hypothetical protein
MTLEGDRHAIVLKGGMPLCDNGRAVAWNQARHRIALASDANAFELHISRTGENGAASGGYVANADDVFHVLLLDLDKPTLSPFEVSLICIQINSI